MGAWEVNPTPLKALTSLIGPSLEDTENDFPEPEDHEHGRDAPENRDRRGDPRRKIGLEVSHQRVDRSGVKTRTSSRTLGESDRTHESRASHSKKLIHVNKSL